MATRSEAHLVTQSRNEEKHSIHSKGIEHGDHKERGQRTLERPELPEGFQGGADGKARGGRCMSSSAHPGVEATKCYFGNNCHQPSGSSLSGVYLLVVSAQRAASVCRWFEYLQNDSRAQLGMLSTALEAGTKGPRHCRLTRSTVSCVSALSHFSE